MNQHGCKTVLSSGKEETTSDIVVRHTRLGAFVGVPALSVPMGFTNEGLPSGLMLMSGQNRDLDVLTVGWAYEKHKPFKFLSF